jgi:hypothetical protein
LGPGAVVVAIIWDGGEVQLLLLFPWLSFMVVVVVVIIVIAVIDANEGGECEGIIGLRENFVVVDAFVELGDHIQWSPIIIPPTSQRLLRSTRPMYYSVTGLLPRSPMVSRIGYYGSASTIFRRRIPHLCRNELSLELWNRSGHFITLLLDALS